jgi:hypothetical protein
MLVLMILMLMILMQLRLRLRLGLRLGLGLMMIFLRLEGGFQLEFRARRGMQLLDGYHFSTKGMEERWRSR